MDKQNRFLIITGMSGAGKSQVVQALEDLGFFCVDNLPPALISKIAELCVHGTNSFKNIALVVDSRGGEFFDDFHSVLKELRDNNMPFELLCLDASDEALVRRYKETRRRHPLQNKYKLLSDCISKERSNLECIRVLATTIMDTSSFKPADLRKKIVELFTRDAKTQSMNINIMSFGFKYGLPIEADLVFDVRFLPNPFYLDELKSKSGLTPEVVEYINSFEVTHEFKAKLADMLNFLIPNYIKEGKSQLIIAIGCTGGMHRSVHLANFTESVCKAHDCETLVIHRDIDKNKAAL